MDTDHPSDAHRTGSPALRILKISVVVLLLLLFVGILIYKLSPLADPVQRQVAYIMDTVRAQDQSERPWSRFVQSIKSIFPNNDADSDNHFSADEALEKLGDKAHPHLLNFAKLDPSHSVRALAIRLLGEARFTNAWPVLVAALQSDPHVQVRAAAATSLPELDPAASIPLLLSALDREVQTLALPTPPSSNAWETQRALDAIVHSLGSLQATNALKPFLRILGDSSLSQIHASVIEGVGQLNLNDPSAAAAIRPFLASSEQNLSSAAVRALGNLHDLESVPALLTLLSTTLKDQKASAESTDLDTDKKPKYSASDWQIRGSLGALVETLGKLGDPRATPLLIQATSSFSEEYELKQLIEAFEALADPRAVPSLQTILAEHPKVAKEAADALASLGHKTIAADLIALLKDSDRDKRAAAAMALANLGDTTALTHLIDLWNLNPVGDQGSSIVEALGIIGDASVLSILSEAIKHSEENIRTQAAWSLGQIGATNGAPLLLHALSDTNFYVRFAAAFSLVSMSHPATLPALEKLFNDSEPRVRTAAACTMAFLGSTNAVPQLAASIHRNDDWQRLASAIALLRLNTSEARQYASTLTTDRDKHLRDVAQLALDQGPTPALTSLLKTGTASYRHYAARLLYFLDDPKAIPALRDALRDSRSDVRVAARISIRRLERDSAPK